MAVFDKTYLIDCWDSGAWSRKLAANGHCSEVWLVLQWQAEHAASRQGCIPTLTEMALDNITQLPVMKPQTSTLHATPEPRSPGGEHAQRQRQQLQPTPIWCDNNRLTAAMIRRERRCRLLQLRAEPSGGVQQPAPVPEPVSATGAPPSAHELARSSDFIPPWLVTAHESSGEVYQLDRVYEPPAWPGPAGLQQSPGGLCLASTHHYDAL